MAEYRERGSFYFVGQKIIAAVHAGQGAGYEKEADDGAGASAERDGGPIAGAADKGNYVGVQSGLEADAGDFLARGGEESRIEWLENDFIEAARIEALFVLGQNLYFFSGGRIADANFQQEAIKLGFGKRIGTLELDGILGGEYGEIFGEEIRSAIDGDLAFFHGFEKGGLRARGGAIDFVDEQQIGEDGAAMEAEGAVAQVEDVGAGNVGGHEIGGALHALEAEDAESGERFHGQSFGQAGHALNDGVTAADEHEHELIDEFLLSDDNFCKSGADLGGERGKMLHD